MGPPLIPKSAALTGKLDDESNETPVADRLLEVLRTTFPPGPGTMAPNCKSVVLEIEMAVTIVADALAVALDCAVALCSPLIIRTAPAVAPTRQRTNPYLRNVMRFPYFPEYVLIVLVGNILTPGAIDVIETLQR